MNLLSVFAFKKINILVSATSTNTGEGKEVRIDLRYLVYQGFRLNLSEGSEMIIVESLLSTLELISIFGSRWVFSKDWLETTMPN